MDNRESITNNENHYKIVVLGTGAVGKSCLTIRFIMNLFTEDYIPTLQDTFRTNFILDGKLVSLGNIIIKILCNKKIFLYLNLYKLKCLNLINFNK